MKDKRASPWVSSGLQSANKSKKKDDSEVRKQIVDIATERRRFGYRRITWLLHRAGMAINKKRVYRIYCEENLQVRSENGRKCDSSVNR